MPPSPPHKRSNRHSLKTKPPCPGGFVALQLSVGSRQLSVGSDKSADYPARIARNWSAPAMTITARSTRITIAVAGRTEAQ
jgi:hypothetical protein